jgi:hypothetical protein
MEATILHIEEKVKKGDLNHARLSDFRCRVETTVDARMILDRPEITLYCLDDASRQAVFVEAPPGVDLSEQPFYFLAQYQNAHRLLTTPYDGLHELAAAMGDRFQTLIPMYSVGRSGGTLVSRAVNRLDRVVSLDEPDIYNNIVQMRPGDGSRDVELTRLLQSGTRLLFKTVKPGADTLFIKFRSMSIEIGDLMYKAFPSSKGMFLYRNAETWARSAGRAIEALIEPHARASGETGARLDLYRLLNPSESSGAQNGQGSRTLPVRGERSAEIVSLRRFFPLLAPYVRRSVRNQMTGSERLRALFLIVGQRIPIVRGHCRTLGEFVEPHIQAIPPMKLLTLLWLSPMHRYLALHALGIPMLAVQYETLVSAPQPTLRAIFEYCGLPVEQAVIAEGAFAEDSQKGTPLSRDRVGWQKRGELPPELLAQLREVLREHHPVETPDFVVPNSLDLSLAAK